MQGERLAKEATLAPSGVDDALQTFWKLRTQTYAATIATRKGRDPRLAPIEGGEGSVARPFRRAIERDPTEGRGRPNSLETRLANVRITYISSAGHKVLCEVGYSAS